MLFVIPKRLAPIRAVVLALTVNKQTKPLNYIYIYTVFTRICIYSRSFVRKLLPQRVCDGREIRPYYRAPHGECHKGVGGRRFATAEKSAAQIPNLMEIDAMLFVRLWMANARFRHVVVCKRRFNAPRGDARALCHAKSPRGTIVR